MYKCTRSAAGTPVAESAAAKKMSPLLSACPRLRERETMPQRQKKKKKKKNPVPHPQPPPYIPLNIHTHLRRNLWLTNGTVGEGKERCGTMSARKTRKTSFSFFFSFRFRPCSSSFQWNKQENCSTNLQTVESYPTAAVAAKRCPLFFNVSVRAAPAETNRHQRRWWTIVYFSRCLNQRGERSQLSSTSHSFVYCTTFLIGLICLISPIRLPSFCAWHFHWQNVKLNWPFSILQTRRE